MQYAETLCNGNPTLWILSNNTVAKNLYQKMGYEFTGKEKILKERLKELEMQKGIKELSFQQLGNRRRK